jgi:hypothetical protein
MAITNINRIQTGLPNQNGKGSVSIVRATYPASTTSATLLVGNISAGDLVEVEAQEAVTGLVGLIELKASRVSSNTGQGQITIGNADGTTGASATVNFEVRIYRN